MPIVLLGQNHRTAPVELREQLAFESDKLESAARSLVQDDVLTEAVILSTCNRVELYGVAEEAGRGLDQLGRVLEEVHEVPLNRIEASLYRSQEAPAIRHLFRVAGGLDSMVLGEGQILSQVKTAYARARDHDLTQETLHRLFNEATACGKRVRTETRVGEGAVSVAYAAVELARKIFKDISEQKVLLIGAGQTGRKVAAHLRMFGVRDILVTNRTPERGQALATELEATLVPWNRYGAHLDDVAIVVSAASVTKPIFGQEMIQLALQKRGRRPLFLIDLGVPRNIDEQVGKRAGVFLYNVDHLEGIVVESSRRRRGEAEKAEEIVDQQVCHFLEWYRARSMTPTLRDLREHLESIRQLELKAAQGRMDPEALAELDRVTRRLVNKILHTPTVRIKDQAGKGDQAGLVRQVRELFGLDDEPAV